MGGMVRGGMKHGAALLAALTLAAAWPGLAQARWLKAETERFIVYGEGRESRVRELAVKLTIFDAVLRALHPAHDKRPPPRKLEVYLVDGWGELRRVRPEVGAHVVGAYLAGPRGTFAIAQMYDGGLQAEEVLFHEYAHAFMLENFPAAYPAWFTEGWAEYFMTVEVSRERAKIGGYNENRAYWLFTAGWIPLEDLVSKTYAQIEPHQRRIYYPQAWLLMHYMRSDPARGAQLDEAVRAIAGGAAPVKAMEEATGQSLAELERALKKYRRLPVLTLPDPVEAEPAVEVSDLPPSADDILLYDLRLRDASPAKPDASALADIRKRAAKWPGDRLAELTLARAEFVYGDPAAGEAIVKRWLEADPNDVEALHVAGVGRLDAGDRDPKRRQQLYRAARADLMKAYGLDNTDYRLLLAYVRSRTVEPAFPTENDITAQLTARAMAPTVDEASVMAGAMLIHRGRADEAKRALAIVANNPHGGQLAAQAREMLAGKTAEQAAQLAAAAPAEDDGTGGPAPPPAGK